MIKYFIMKQINKNKKNPLKALSIFLIFLCSCVMTFLAIVLSQIYFEILYNYEANRIIFKSPYGIEKQAARFDMYLREYDFYKVVPNYIANKREELYSEIKNKLPVDDVLLDIFAFKIKYPFFTEISISDPTVIQDILLLFDKIKTKKSNIIGVEKIYKTEIVSYLLYLIINNRHINSWTFEHIQKYINEYLANQINYINDDNSKEHLYLLLLIGEVQFDLYYEQLIDKHPEKTSRCKSPEYRLLKRHLEAIYKIVNYCKIDDMTNCLSHYRNARSTPKEWPDLVYSTAATSINNMLKQKDKLDNFDKEYCAVK